MPASVRSLLLLVALALSCSADDAALAGAADPAHQPFIDALNERIQRDRLVPEFGSLEIAPLHVDRPTFSFRSSGHVVLQLNIYGYPDPKGTAARVAPLIEAAVSAAIRHPVVLTGIEIVFHRRRSYHPMQAWSATPPWGREQTFMTPLSSELIESMAPRAN